MAYSDEMIQSVWEKGRGMQDRSQDEWRKDRCGAWMQRDQYNNEDSGYGWKILNIAAGGSVSPDDLYPFHWKNSFDIENGEPICRVMADRAGMEPDQFVDPPRNTGS